jgi:hypothetical protein
MGAAVARAFGFEAAAHFLGDSPATVMDTYGFLDSSQVNTERLPGVSDTFVEFKSLATPAIPATAVAAGSESRAATPLRSEAVRARL